jgi:hypothetical protein
VDKKPLIGVSICAVVLLVLASLSNVVGYQSVKSTVVNDSPLFKTRTQRATNQQQNIITSQYLGKGSENIIPIPLRANQLYLFQEIIYKIREMNDKEFNDFKQIVIRHLINEKLIQYKENNKVIDFFNQIMSNTNEINQNITKRIKEPPTWMDYCFTVPGAWNSCQSTPECIFYKISFLIIITVYICITVIIYVIMNSILRLLEKLTIKVCE